MSEPPNETEPPDQPRPFQFTIGSLVILTAAVAVFFALLTQAPEFLVLYLFFPAGVWLFPKHWRGIFAAVLCATSNLPLIFFNPYPIMGTECCGGFDRPANSSWTLRFRLTK